MSAQKDTIETNDAVQAYHGEASPELSAAIWKEAERRYPTEPTHQSAFNDGCFWLVTRVRSAQVELKRLHDLDQEMRKSGGWTDEEAFKKLNSQITEAYKKATAALADLTGDDAIDRLWYLAPQAHDFTHRELTSHLHVSALSRKSYPEDHEVAKRIFAALDVGCDGTCKDLGGCGRG